MLKQKIKTYLKNAARQKGQSLVEMLLYMGLLSILITSLSSIFSATIQAQLESKATSSVDQDGRYIISKLTRDFSNLDTTSNNITTPATPGTTTSSLQMSVGGNSYTYSLNGNNLQLVNNNGTDQLNSTDTKVSNLTFTRVGNGDSKDTIQVSFTLTSTTTRDQGAQIKTFQTTLSGVDLNL